MIQDLKPWFSVLAGASVWINLHYLYPDVVNQHLFILATMQTCRDWWCEHYLFMLATIQTCRDWWGEHLQLIVSNDIPARLSIILNNCFPNHIWIQLYDRRKRHLKEKEREKWAQIDYRYMTDESEQDSDTVLQHQLPWRSGGKFYFLKVVLELWPNIQ